jgi:hypothetical protein
MTRILPKPVTFVKYINANYYLPDILLIVRDIGR